MVQYRPVDFYRDRNEIIDLVNQNLTPRNSNAFFEWKHLRNPRGRSTGAVAIINGEIVAVVFYLAYDFADKNGAILRTMRPVEGCTSKKHRGKGIFKILMKYCLSLCNDNYKFLFANPNQYSHPEFLKMGWKELKDYEYQLGLVQPLKFPDNIRFDPISPQDLNENIPLSHNYYISGSTENFISWRFSTKKYSILKFVKGGSANFIIYRIHRKNKVKCIILCEYLGKVEYLDAAVKKICRLEKTIFVYFLKNRITAKINFIITRKHRNVVITYKEKEPGIIDNIEFSLGDLEGIL